jgi:ribosome biogenesis protein Nip4
LILIHDADGVGQKEKKITFDSFKTALNIPIASSDEKVAVVAGGTAGFVWGTDGSDGIFRMNSSMSWTKDAGNAFVTLAVGTVDGGTY